MCAAARRANLPADLNLSLVEHFTDGPQWDDGLHEGFRFDIVKGQPSFRTGVEPGERGDLTVNTTRAASLAFSKLKAVDAEWEPTMAKYMNAGEFTVDGDLSQLFGLIGNIHDEVVDRTAQ